MLRYGNTRELVLGLEVVLADGRVWDGLRGLRKDNTGYDLKQLFIGAEGTLGIITAAVLKLFPRRARAVTALVARGHASTRRMRAAARLKRALGDRLTGFELMQRLRARAVAQAPSRRARPAARPSVVRAGPGRRQRGRCAAAPRWSKRRSRPPSEAGDVARRGRRAVRRRRPAQLWALRENISEAQRREGPNIKHDISLPVSAIPAFIERVRRGARAPRFPGARLVVFGHLGDGNLHYNLSRRRAATRRRRSWHMHARVPTASSTTSSRAHGGSFSAEHGIGQLKRDELVALQERRSRCELMRAIKAALDPRGLMNPGKVL